MQSHELDGKVALVTGAPHGIGGAISHALARCGASVALNWPDGEADTGAVSEAVADTRIVAVRSRRDDTSDIARMFDAAEHALGPLDIVINAMEPVQEWADVADLSLETYDAITQQAAKMPFFVLQQAALRVCTDGRLLLVMPDATLPAGFTGAAHAGAAAAAAVYLRVLAREVGSRGITVNAISRKPHEYTTGHASQPSTSADARVDRDRDHGMSGDIAALTAFLAGPDARWINGQILHVDSVRPA